MTRRTVPVRGAGGSSSSSAPTVQTFSNAAATISEGTDILVQTGTMSAPRVVTLPAASSAVAGTVVEIVDASGTVTNPLRLTLIAAGSDTLTGLYPVIHVAGGRLRAITNGSNSWRVFDSSTPDVLWRFNDYDTTQFTVVQTDASVTHALSVATDAQSNRPSLVMTSGGATGYKFWRINDFSLEANPSYEFRANIGPGGANCLPVLACAWQHENRWCAYSRHSTSSYNASAFWIRNNSATLTSLNPGANIAETGSTTGATVLVDNDIRLPTTSPSIDMGWHVEFQGTPSGGAAKGPRLGVNGTSTSFTGGSPPSSGWDAAWKGGGTLYAGVGIYGTVTAATSFLRGFSINRTTRIA